MYYRAEQILSAYPNEFTATAKGRGSLLCTDADGIWLLKEYHGSPQRLELVEETLNALLADGFLTERLVRTTEGALCYTDADGSRYILRKTYQGRECDTRNADEVLYVIRHLAKLHLLMAGIGAQQADTYQMQTDAAQKHTRELRKVRNYVRAKKKNNAFESEFLRCYEHYLEQAQQVLTLEQELEIPASGVQLCHGDFHQHNLIFTKEGLAVIGFERLHYGLRVSDLATFMRKILEKHNWDSGLGMDMVMAYQKVAQLSDWELKKLYLLLLYPEKYWKIVNHYYNARKTWVSQRDTEKLVRIYGQEQRREEFLSLLFYLVK